MARAKPRPTARQAALGLIARRQLTDAEVRQRLARRGYPTTEVEDAAAMLAEFGYLDERAVIDAVRREAERCARGPGWIRATLRRRGISEARADAEALADEAAAQARAGVALQARFGAKDLLDAPARARARRYLVARGFSFDTVLALLGEEL